jgi:hypothetical protein
MMLSLLLAVSLSAGSQEFESSAAAGAAQLARAKMIEDALSSSPVQGTLFSAMTADPAKHRVRAVSEEVCRGVYRRELVRELDAKAAAAAKRLAVAFPGGGLSGPEIEKIVSKHFSAVFAAERSRAVAAQAQTISRAIKAPEAAFEKKDDATLAREMTEKVVSQRRAPVFEENLNYISEEIVRPVIAAGRREMKRQREYVQRARCDLDRPGAMAKEILGHLERNVAARTAEAPAGTMTWGVFPATAATAADETVERRILDAVARNVDEAPLPLDPESICRRLMTDPAGHFKAAQSEKIFRADAAEQLLTGALHLAGKGLSEEARKEVSGYVNRRLSSPRLKRAVETRLRRDVLPKWRAARAEAARTEAGKIWPTLLDRTWSPDAALADRLAARSDYAAAVAAWRDEPELAALAKAGAAGLGLEETAGVADRSILAAFDLSRTAIVAQNAVIDQVVPAVLAEAKDRKSSFWRRTPDLPAIVEMLTQAVAAKWDQTRVTTLWKEGPRPRNAAEQHVDLFPSVKKRIELVARSIFEQMEKPQAVPEEKREPETPPQAPAETAVTVFTIVVERDGEQLAVKLESGGSTLVERKVDAKMREFRGAVKVVTEKLGHDVLKLK